MAAKKKVLVVDDEAGVCEAIAMMLSFEGFEAVTANSGEEALAKLALSSFDLVTTDYTMPGMTGAELARALKAKAPGVPVILITAHGDMLKAAGVSLAGVDQLVSKPFQLADLRKAIQKVTSR